MQKTKASDTNTMIFMLAAIRLLAGIQGEKLEVWTSKDDV
jgi:hypothetical protein